MSLKTGENLLNYLIHLVIVRGRHLRLQRLETDLSLSHPATVVSPWIGGSLVLPCEGEGVDSPLATCGDKVVH